MRWSIYPNLTPEILLCALISMAKGSMANVNKRDKAPLSNPSIDMKWLRNNIVSKNFSSGMSVQYLYPFTKSCSKSKPFESCK